MKNILYLVLTFLLIISCNQSDEFHSSIGEPSVSEIDISSNFGAEVSRDFYGVVMDKDKNPIAGVSIVIGASSTITDANGVFIIKNATVHEQFAYVRAEKMGYLMGSRALVPTEGMNKVEIMMLSNSPIASITSGQEETVSLPNGTKVTFSGEFINDQDGSAYSGTVDVVLHHLDPSDDDMRLQMPGMLYAGTSENEENVLESYGMVAVELYGSGGEKLNLATNTRAKITMPLASDVQSAAPQSIPLWYFDEEVGYWKEEGEAQLVGNEYVGEVTHFSFWNYDANFPTVNICITLVDENGDPLANERISLSHSNSGYSFPTTHGFTDENGMVCGLIPSGEELVLNHLSYSYCTGNSVSLYTENIGPFSSDTSITVVSQAGVTEEDYVNITGSLLSCDNNPVTNGYIAINQGNSGYPNFVPVIDGTIDFNMLACDLPQEFSFVGYDSDNLQASETLTQTITTNSFDFGTLITCNTVDEYITYQIDNGEIVTIFNSYAILYPSNTQNNNLPTLNISSQNNNCFYLEGVLNSPDMLGTYDYLDYSDPNDTGFFFSECPIQIVNDSSSTLEYIVSNIGDIGEYIDITINGTYEDPNGATHTITVTIHEIRNSP